VKNEKVKSSEEILDQIRKEMLLFNDQPEFKGKFPNKWVPSNFQILEEEFSEDNKMINSTLKMVRHRITETYQDRLDAMYGTNTHKKALEENLKIIETLFK
jgi:long-chain acyl-CoA synthetase